MSTSSDSAPTRPATSEHDATAAQLVTQLRDLRAQRERDEAEAAQLDLVLRAVQLSRCDRDAGSSPALAGHRAHLERVWADLEQLMATTARLAIRLHLRTAAPDDPLTRRAQRAIHQSQQALAAFAEAVNKA